MPEPEHRRAGEAVPELGDAIDLDEAPVQTIQDWSPSSSDLVGFEIQPADTRPRPDA